MQHLNKYWKISGWHIFDLLDRKAHEIAIDIIGECVTANASINFYNQLEEWKWFIFDSNHTWVNEKKCEVYIWMKNEKLIASATFLFIKK